MGTSNLLHSANNIYFTSITDLVSITKIEDIDIIRFYSSLHHYCELMMRHLVILKDPIKNIKDSGSSVNAMDLLGIIKDLYSSDFFNENKLEYKNFPSFFKKISNIRNSYAHEGAINASDKTITDIINDYIICFYVLNKEEDFIENYYIYLELKLISIMNSQILVNLDRGLTREEILGVYIDEFVNIFRATKFKSVIFGIKNSFLEIECPKCRHYTSIFKIPTYHYKHNTLIKIYKDAPLFKCYICNYEHEMKEIDCEDCILNGISSSFAYTEENICIYCKKIAEPYNQIYCDFKLPKFKPILEYVNIDNHIKSIKNNLFLRIRPQIIVEKKTKYRFFYNPKNSYNKIKNIKTLLSFFESINPEYSDHCEFLNENKTIKETKRYLNRCSSFFENKNYEYLNYWSSFFSYKNCVYIHLNKTVTLSSYFPIFEYKNFKTNLYYDIIRYVKKELDDLISKTENENLITFINGQLFYEINKIIKKNIFSNKVDGLDTVIQVQSFMNKKRINTDKIVNEVWFLITKGKFEIPNKVLKFFDFIKKQGDSGIRYQELPDELYKYYEKKILTGRKRGNNLGCNIYQAENIILEAFGLYECDGFLNFSKMTKSAKKYLESIKTNLI